MAMGFLHATVPRADLSDEVNARLERLVALAPHAARLNKQTLRALSGGQPDVQALVATAYDYAESAEHREGITAFREKRAPRYG